MTVLARNRKLQKNADCLNRSQSPHWNFFAHAIGVFSRRPRASIDFYEQSSTKLAALTFANPLLLSSRFQMSSLHPDSRPFTPKFSVPSQCDRLSTRQADLFLNYFSANYPHNLLAHTISPTAGRRRASLDLSCVFQPSGLPWFSGLVLGLPETHNVPDTPPIPLSSGLIKLWLDFFFLNLQDWRCITMRIWVTVLARSNWAYRSRLSLQEFAPTMPVTSR